MKITKGKLRKLIKEYEQYVDEDGNVWDDEGNVTRKGAAFGRQYGGGTYGTSAPWQGGRSKSRYSQSRRKTTAVGTGTDERSVHADRVTAVEKALAAKPNNFLSSVLSQLKKGRNLSSKQKSIVKRIVAKFSPDDATLFESSGTSAYDGWTEGDLAQAIRDYSKELTGRRDTYGHPDDLQSLTWLELSDHYEEMFDSPEAVAFRDQREMEDQKFANSEVGHDEEDHPLERSPLRQGMGHRQEAAGVTLLKKLVFEELSLEKGRDLDYPGKNEGKMARQQLFHIAEYSSELYEMLNDGDDLPGWVQGKLAVMSNDIGKIKHYLEYKLMTMGEGRLLENTSHATVELTDQPDRRAIGDAWPERVTHNGKNVFDTFYGDNAADAHDWLSREGYEGQEAYLGYDPESDNFVMGFDAFYDEVDEYGNSDPGDMMEGVLLLLDPRGRVLETITSVPGGIYPAGLRAARHAMPKIIDVRLD